MIMFGSFLPSLLVGFSTTNFTRAGKPTLSWNQFHSNPPSGKTDECNREWVLKKSVIGMSFGLRLSLLPSFLFSPQLSGSFHSGGGRLAEEPHQSLEVLGCRCQEELLTNKLHPA